MDKALKFFQILNQIVWIVVGIASIYSIYYFMTHSPIEQISKAITPLVNGSQTLPPGVQNNPQVQKLLQQYSK